MMIIFVTRGRNKITNELVARFGSKDFNFDYRGTSKLLALIKMAITANELDINDGDVIVFEGIMCAFISNFVRRRARIFVLYANGPDFAISKRKFSWKHLLLRMILRRLDKIVVISEMVSQDAKIILPKTQIFNVGFVSQTSFPKKMRMENRITTTKRKKYIISLDRPNETGWVKGLDLCIAAFREIQKLDVEVELHITGRGTENLQFDNLKNYVCHGFVDMHKFLPSMDWALILSRYDAFNLFGLECLYHGVVPIFSENVGLATELELPKECMISGTEVTKVLDLVNAEDYRLLVRDAFIKYSEDNSFFNKFSTAIASHD